MLTLFVSESIAIVLLPESEAPSSNIFTTLSFISACFFISMSMTLLYKNILND
uniref:Candidate secreted effector n=1 Tax=Meloidogyne incognita TaxID=6306 RepID=A0A914MEV6_MELIC